jgi:serine/threonine-protein kinase
MWIGCVAFGTHGWASAQPRPRDPAGAEKLFSEARKLLDAGQFAEACQKLADSQQLDPGVGTLLNLAQCYERMGKTATAWATYREAADAAKMSGQVERERKAARAADALLADLAKFTVTVPEVAAAKGVEVTRNGMPVPRSLWGVSEPIDPGEYVIVAHTPGGKPWSTRIKVEPGRVAVVILPPFEDPATGSPGATTPSGPTVSNTPAPTQITEPTASIGGMSERGIAGRRLAELGLLAAGVGAVAFGTVEWFRFSSKNEDMIVACGVGARCPTASAYSEYLSLHDEASTARTMSWIGFAVGGAAVATGFVLLLTESSRKSNTMATVVPVFGPRETTLQWRRTW